MLSISAVFLYLASRYLEYRDQEPEAAPQQRIGALHVLLWWKCPCAVFCTILIWLDCAGLWSTAVQGYDLALLWPQVSGDVESAMEQPWLGMNHPMQLTSQVVEYGSWSPARTNVVYLLVSHCSFGSIILTEGPQSPKKWAPRTSRSYSPSLYGVCFSSFLSSAGQASENASSTKIGSANSSSSASAGAAKASAGGSGTGKGFQIKPTKQRTGGKKNKINSICALL